MDSERQSKINELAEMFSDTTSGTPFYLMATGEQNSAMDFETHFNPKLALHSNYFGALQKMMQCAQSNTGKADTVCAREFKELRLAAFKDELLYHNVNKRFFMNELAFKNQVSPQ